MSMIPLSYACLRLEKEQEQESKYLGMEHRKILEICVLLDAKEGKQDEHILETTNQCLQSSFAIPCLAWTQTPVLSERTHRCHGCFRTITSPPIH